MSRGTSPESQAALAAGVKAVLREKVLGFVRQRGLRGSTADELAAGLDLVANSVAPRVTELRQRGLVIALIDAAGKPVRRRTRQGCLAAVFIVADVVKPVSESESRFGRNSSTSELGLFGSMAPERYGVD